MPKLEGLLTARLIGCIDRTVSGHFNLAVVGGHLKQLRIFGAAIGLAFFGPGLLIFSVFCLIRGHSFVYSPLSVTEDPIRFYVIFITVGLTALMWTFVGILLTILYARKSPAGLSR
jgi:hypothetical protein